MRHSLRFNTSDAPDLARMSKRARVRPSLSPSCHQMTSSANCERARYFDSMQGPSKHEGNITVYLSATCYEDNDSKELKEEVGEIQYNERVVQD